VTNALREFDFSGAALFTDFVRVRVLTPRSNLNSGHLSPEIALNAGAEGAVIVGRVRESKDDNFGFNADTDEFGDMIKAGVIDPAKVTRLALQNAASIAGLIAHHRSAGGRHQGTR